MNKTHNINLAGVVFTIDETAYEALKNYLASVKQYFSVYEDSREIIVDIENRIAEKLKAILEQSGRQVVTDQDIHDVIGEMGSARDFQAFDEQGGDLGGSFSFEKNDPEQIDQDYRPHRRLTRLKNRHVLGGVCTGLAEYLDTEIWIVRLLFIISIFFAGTGLIAYFALWISVPDSYKLPEELRFISQRTEKSVKIYRNVSDQVLGGVSSGLAAYFSIDPVIIRLLFVVSIFLGGAGIILYIILWMVLPVARTLVEKVEMSGMKANIENIEAAARQGTSDYQNREPHPIIKVLFLPVKVIEVILKWINEHMSGFFKGFLHGKTCFFSISYAFKQGKYGWPGP
jgi:phage shock protein PspC (stress-responsive transcriptional regulator)